MKTAYSSSKLVARVWVTKSDNQLEPSAYL
jgi:hypothetical protein